MVSPPPDDLDEIFMNMDPSREFFTENGKLNAQKILESPVYNRENSLNTVMEVINNDEAAGPGTDPWQLGNHDLNAIISQLHGGSPLSSIMNTPSPRPTSNAPPVFPSLAQIRPTMLPKLEKAPTQPVVNTPIVDNHRLPLYEYIKTEPFDPSTSSPCRAPEEEVTDRCVSLPNRSAPSRSADTPCSTYSAPTPDDGRDSVFKPRSYRRRPEVEKTTEEYRQKRDKNNEAVRKSRDKAKKKQEEISRLADCKSEEVKKLRREVKNLKAENERLKARPDNRRLLELEAANDRLQGQNRELRLELARQTEFDQAQPAPKPSASKKRKRS